MNALKALARAIGILISILVPLAIVGAAVVGAVILIKSREEVPKTEYEREATTVEVSVVEGTKARVRVEGFGTVQPHRRVTLQSEVAGRVLEIHPELVLGGLIPAESLLVRIDDREMKLQAEATKGEVARADFELKVEQGQQAVAKKSWEMLEGTVPESSLGRDLALRIPHIAEKTAALEAARSRHARNLLDIERCTIRAPFNALVTEENVEVGELMSVRASVARLVCTDDFHVETTLSLPDLEIVARRIRAGEKPRVEVVQALGADRELRFEGRVYKLLGALEAETRLARVLVEIEDPLRLRPGRENELPLLLGAYVRVEIEGPEIEKAYELPRKWLRDGSTVWVMDEEGKLEIREVEVTDRRERSVLVTGGLEDGDRVVTSALTAVVSGMKLRVEDEGSEGAAKDGEGGSSPSSDEESAR